MRKLLFLLLLALTINCGGPTLSVKSSVDLAPHISSQTIALVDRDEDGDVSPYCTGVWVSEDLILTAHHCVLSQANKQAHKDDDDEGTKVVGVKIYYIVESEVTGLFEEPTTLHRSTVIADDKKHDLALVKATGKTIPKHEVAVLAKESPKVGERVYITGHVQGLYWTFIEGLVSSKRSHLPKASGKVGAFMQVSAPVFFSNSGGGAFNDRGELVGIASMIFRSTPSCAFYIPVKSIRRFIEPRIK